MGHIHDLFQLLFIITHVWVSKRYLSLHWEISFTNPRLMFCRKKMQIFIFGGLIIFMSTSLQFDMLIIQMEKNLVWRT